MSSYPSRRSRRHLQITYGGKIGACRERSSEKACAVTVDCSYAPIAQQPGAFRTFYSFLAMACAYPTLSGAQVGAITFPVDDAARRFSKYRCRAFKLTANFKIGPVAGGPNYMWLILYSASTSAWSHPAWYTNWNSGTTASTNYNTNLKLMKQDPRTLAFQLVSRPANNDNTFYTKLEAYVPMYRLLDMEHDDYEEDTTCDGQVGSSATPGSYVFTAPTKAMLNDAAEPYITFYILSAQESSTDTSMVVFGGSETAVEIQCAITKYFLFHDPIIGAQVLPSAVALAS